MLRFPEKFYFGSASSATQSEGSFEGDGKGKDIWDQWFESEPEKFYGEVGPNKTTAMYKNYKEDIKLLKQTGHNSFRTSISWARLFPKGYGDVNEEAVKYYKDYFQRLKENDIEPFVNLFHFDMPMELQKIGGWENRKVVDYYREYAKTCFELFGDIVKRWFTFNEPIVHVECGYLNQYHYPMKVDAKLAVQVGYHTALASAYAIKEFKESKIDGKIGIVLNLSPAYPRSNNNEDLKAAEIAESFQNKSFLDPAIKGEFNELLVSLIKKHDLMPEYDREDLEIIKENTVDFLGVNYYQPVRVKAKEHLPNPNAPFLPTYYFDLYDMPGKKMNKYRGWEIYEKGIYDIALNIKNEYDNIEWMITENGMGVQDEDRFKKDGIIEDDYRIDFFKGHLKWLHKGIEEGSNCIGYHIWTPIDCWSWLNAYKNKYGLIELDLETQERTIKKSGYWFKQLSDNKGFEL
ncbi:glycoside hydrolase family 1 protein [Senegalia massiliensis]|uniref:Glycoside hydrolase family 1 protein n=1 Tax=Senegalia massiliensis TaxID=1720316 RepID=A0A845R1A6_9CLOT|nr:glycoside hydrolase family 1 protein [Senegalia massiliensis]NBI07212.1 glycoside hydrolase family 1 protein [Senegalia massiliensis]